MANPSPMKLKRAWCISEKATAEALGISLLELRHWRVIEVGPKPKNRGIRRVVWKYRQVDIDKQVSAMRLKREDVACSGRAVGMPAQSESMPPRVSALIDRWPQNIVFPSKPIPESEKLHGVPYRYLQFDGEAE